MQALGKGSNIHVEHDACHIFVECALHVDRRIVNKDAFLRAKGELVQEGAVDLRVGLQQLDLFSSALKMVMVMVYTLRPEHTYA